MWMRVGEREATLLAACLAAAVAFSIASPSFATADNLLTVLRASQELLARRPRYDLAACHGQHRRPRSGSSWALRPWPWGVRFRPAGRRRWPVSSGPVVGTLMGAVTASVVVLGRVPPIVGTLGLFGVYRAAVFLVLGGSWLSGLPGDLTLPPRRKAARRAGGAPRRRGGLRGRRRCAQAHAVRAPPSQHRPRGGAGAIIRRRCDCGPASSRSSSAAASAASRPPSMSRPIAMSRRRSGARSRWKPWRPWSWAGRA